MLRISILSCGVIGAAMSDAAANLQASANASSAAVGVAHSIQIGAAAAINVTDDLILASSLLENPI